MQARLTAPDYRFAAMMEPHTAYTRLLTAPSAAECVAFPASCFTTRLSQDQLNKKLRSSVNCVAVCATTIVCVCVRACGSMGASAFPLTPVIVGTCAVDARRPAHVVLPRQRSNHRVERLHIRLRVPLRGVCV